MSVVDRLEEMADLLEANDVEYKPRAYRRAAENLREYPGSIEELAREDPDALEEIEGVGEAIASKVVEYVETGSIEELDELRADLPADMPALTRVEGVGPKTVGALYEALGVETLADLERAAREGKVREVSGFGAKTEQNILEAVEFAREAGDRLLLGAARPVADDALAHLRAADAVERASVAGSIRRWKETVGDVDVLVASEDDPAAVEAFTTWPAADDVIEAGELKASVRADGVRVDLRVVDPDEFGSALQYFTGSRDHNVRLRNLAIDRGLKMNEYGVFAVPDGASPGEEETDSGDGADETDGRTDSEADDPAERVGERVAGETEESMYGAVDLPWIPPELRRDCGEVEAAREDRLPALVEEGDLRGDLHTHTDWSDGDESVAAMAAAAAEFGHDYYAVTDHAAGAGVPPEIGLTEAELREQVDAVAAVAADAAVELFHGVEANVTADGELDVADDLLADLDVVVASPHAALGQDVEAATERLVAAVEHPHVDVLGHPSGRMLNERPGLTFDVERVAAAAAESGTALEINANPHRLDLWGDAVQAAVGAGATVAVNTDAHRPSNLEYLRYGVHTARRGWAEPADVLNARDADGVRAFLE